MMNKRLMEFMAAAYQQQVMGQAIVNPGQVFQKYKDDPDFMKAAKTEMARLKKLPSNLAARDFVAYHMLQALEKELN